MLVELAVGDAYGAGFEYVEPSLVHRHNDLSGYFKHPRHGIKPGCYIEGQLVGQAFIHFHSFERNGRRLHVAITDRLRAKCRKEGVWKSKEMLVPLQNASYGLDETMARSLGGRDGIFLLDRDHRPRNAMMKKMFDQFLDKPDSEAKAIADLVQTSVDQLRAARLVSHHLRLLDRGKSPRAGQPTAGCGN